MELSTDVIDDDAALPEPEARSVEHEYTLNWSPILRQFGGWRRHLLEALPASVQGSGSAEFASSGRVAGREIGCGHGLGSVVLRGFRGQDLLDPTSGAKCALRYGAPLDSLLGQKKRGVVVKPKGKPQVPPLRCAPVGMTNLCGCEHPSTQTDLSSRPERTRISCHATPDTSACAVFRKRKPHAPYQRHQDQQEIRGSGVEGPAVQCQ